MGRRWMVADDEDVRCCNTLVEGVRSRGYNTYS
uniref:Uncharacterized protein n=1 Tax=Arundo donax TaxID=35708 RepID=A0A0A9A236_ARUDO